MEETNDIESGETEEVAGAGDSPDHYRKWFSTILIAIMILGFGLSFALWKQAQSNKKTNNLADASAKIINRLALDEESLRDTGNKTVIGACDDLNDLKTKIGVSLTQSTNRTITAQTLILQSPSSTAMQREQAVRLIASAKKTQEIVDKIFETEKCEGPF